MKRSLLLLASLFSAAIYAQGSYPVHKGAEWHYLDNGTSMDATAWNATGTANDGWAEGIAPLGYGDPTATVISYGPDANNKYITSYFYRDIEINPSNLTDVIQFGIRRDDGAIVYVNGVEVFRDNMPAEPTDYLTFSSTIIDGANEKRYYVHDVPKTAFVNGINRIAVEMHNRDGQSSDIGFDLYIQNTDESLIVSCDDDHVGCFTSITPTAQLNHMVMPEETRFQILFKEGDSYTTGGGIVAGNHDFAGFIPLDGSSGLGHLSVNQENTPGGVSMLDLHFDESQRLWVVDETQLVDMYNTDLVTTSRNCSGGVTQWGTVITAEEATNAGDANADGYQDLGWLVEIDPATAAVMDYNNDGVQDKLWKMGRMNHENVVVTNDGTTAYYGEDGGTHCVYKFVADTPGDLTEGTVYVLKLDLGLSNDEPSSATATWVEVPNATQADCNNITIAAGALGGTNFNGVEDCEISPLDGKIYFTTKGKSRVYRFRDNGITITEFETFVGDAAMTYPIETATGIVNEPWGDGNDNLTFDEKGNLWVLQDGGLNYIWVIRPDHTQSNPKVKLFASMPAGSEPTGLTFTPDYKFGFFSVQHPNADNIPQLDAAFNMVPLNASATVVFALNADLGVQTPAADFVASEVLVDEGETVTFTDLSTNNPTSWAWTFEGGTPATSTEEAPVVTYAEAGTYNVTLVSSNPAGVSPAVAKTGYIVVEEVLGTNMPNPLKDIVSLYPNPTNGLVTIEVNNDIAAAVAIEVYDLTGRKLSDTNGQNIGGSQKIEVNLSKFAGEQVFIIRVHVGDKTGNYKLLKVN